MIIDCLGSLVSDLLELCINSFDPVWHVVYTVYLIRSMVCYMFFLQVFRMLCPGKSMVIAIKSESETIDTFRKKLKTYSFEIAFPLLMTFACTRE